MRTQLSLEVKKMNYHTKTLPFSLDKGLSKQAKFDENGVLLSKIPYTQEWHYHLTSIASYVIKTRDEANLQWIIDNLDSNGVYHHDFIFPWYPMKEGWVGGLAQGLALSALARNSEQNTALKAFHGLQKYCMEDNIIFEYPGVEILNGWIFALFGIYDVNKENIFYTCIDTLKSRLDFYLKGIWSRYDMFGIPSTLFYHDVVTEQMYALFLLTEDEYFLDAYIHMSFCRTAPLSIIYSKVKRGLFILKKHNVRLPKRYMEMKRWKE